MRETRVRRCIKEDLLEKFEYFELPRREFMDASIPKKNVTITAESIVHGSRCC
jgi:hypothetical protein